MYKNKKVILFAFASKDLSKSINRLNKQAKDTSYYDEIKIYNPNDFDTEMLQKYKEIISKSKNRGYGYWFWKPYFLRKIMNETESGNIIHYVDIGCHLQKKNERFYEYLDLLINSNKWILAFQYYVDKKKFPNDIFFSEREEFKYTKADLLDYFNFLNDKKITHTPQFWAGSFFLVKTKVSQNFVNEWINIFEKKIDLINDTNSNIENLEGFIENRHDQSAFSLLCKKYKIDALSAYECEWGEKKNQRTWEHNIDNPILAKRDLKYNILRRFINRQIRTFNRYKKKFF